MSRETETLTLRSSIDPSSKSFQTLLEPMSRVSSISKLPPLPTIPQPSHSSPPSPSALSKSSAPPDLYPSYTLPTRALLPLLPRATKPPLPPRPNANPRGSNSPAATGSSRIAGFASLFGVKAGGPSNTPPPAQLVNSTPPGSPAAGPGHGFGFGFGSSPAPVSTPAADSVIEGDPSSHQTIDVAAYAISRRIIRDDVGKQITKGIKAEINDALVGGDEEGIHAPGWVAERVIGFVGDMMPLVKSIKKQEQSQIHSQDRGNAKKPSVGMSFVAGKGTAAGKSGFNGQDNKDVKGVGGEVFGEYVR